MSGLEVVKKRLTLVPDWQDHARMDPDTFGRYVASRLYRELFRAFVAAAWPVADAGRPFRWNWHIGVVADHVQALVEGRLKGNKLGICIPPGMGKSLVVSVLLPAWLWLRNPSLRILTVSAVDEVLRRDAIRMRDLVDSEWFRTTFAPTWTWRPDQKSKAHIMNTAGGARVMRTTGQRVIGQRADIILIDDPLDAAAAHADKNVMDVVWDYYSTVLPSRADRDTKWLLIQQRLHPQDLVGRLLEAEPDQWDWVILPNEFDGVRRMSSLGAYDPRKEKGELLFPWLLGGRRLEELKETLTLVEYQTQYQQNPGGKDVGIIDPDQFAVWTDGGLPDKWDIMVVSADLTWKTKGSRLKDYGVMQVWGLAGSYYYLLDQWREKQYNIPQLVSVLVKWVRRYPDLKVLLIEDRGVSDEVIRAFKERLRETDTEGIRIEKVNPQGTSKRERVELILKDLEKGRIIIPDPGRRRWVARRFLPEMRSFGHPAAHDDQVDAMSQAIIWLKAWRKRRSGGGPRVAVAMSDLTKLLRGGR